MLLQTGFSVNELIGIALLVGLALLLTVLTKVPFLKGFVCYCLIISGFLYQAQLIPFWLIILLIVSVILLSALTLIQKRRGSG